MKKALKRSIVAILAIIGLFMITGCKDEEMQALYGPPSSFGILTLKNSIHSFATNTLIEMIRQNKKK